MTISRLSRLCRSLSFEFGFDFVDVVDCTYLGLSWALGLRFCLELAHAASRELVSRVAIRLSIHSCMSEGHNEGNVPACRSSRLPGLRLARRALAALPSRVPDGTDLGRERGQPPQLEARRCLKL